MCRMLAADFCCQKVALFHLVQKYQEQSGMKYAQADIFWTQYYTSMSLLTDYRKKYSDSE